MANIWIGHFDEDQIRRLTRGVSYPQHKSFDVWVVAFSYLRSFCPNCKTPEDVNLMNANAPEEASNLEQIVPESVI